MHLVLFFTRGQSLQKWQAAGVLEREVALYGALRDKGVKVTFVTYGDKRDLQLECELPGIRILCNRFGLRSDQYERWLVYIHAPTLARASIYKTNQANGAMIALTAAQRWRKPLLARCGYLWSRFAERKHGGGSEAAVRARMLEEQVFRSAEGIVVTTSDMKQHIEQQYGVEASKTTVIPNYIMTEVFRPDTLPAVIPRSICFVGRLEPQKNLHTLLEAAQDLGVRIDLIGDGRERRSIEDRARALGVDVRFHGQVPHSELPRFLNRAEAFIMPSQYEGHPKALIEAMACGCAVIGTDVPGIRNLIKHRSNGYICKPTPESMRGAITEVLSDRILRRRLSLAARQYAEHHFALASVVDKELQILFRLAGRIRC